MPELNKGINKLHSIFIVTILWAVISLPYLGSAELKGEEGRRAMPGIEMIESGNWLIPYIGGEPYFSKPPMINWIAAASIKLCGSVTEFAIRLPSTLAILALCITVLLAPCKQLNVYIRILCCFIILGTPILIEKGRVFEIEAVFIAQVAIAYFWWFLTTMDGRNSIVTYSISALAIAAALLTKGPIAYLAFYCMIISYTIVTREKRHLISIGHLLFIIFTVGSLYCWYYAVSKTGLADQLSETASYAMGSRMSLARLNISSWLTAVGKSILNFMPWMLLIPCCWMKAFTEKIPQEQRKAFRALKLAFLIGMIAYNAFPGTMARYSLPVLPIGMLLLAWTFFYSPQYDQNDKTWKTVLFAMLYILPGAAIGLMIKTGIAPKSIITVIAICVCSIAIIRKRQILKSKPGLTILTTIVIAMSTNLYSTFGSGFDKEGDTRQDTAKMIDLQIPKDDTLYLCHPGYQAFIFYLNSEYKYIAPEEIKNAYPTHLLIRERHYNQLNEESQDILAKYKTQLDFVYREKGRFLLLVLK